MSKNIAVRLVPAVLATLALLSAMPGVASAHARIKSSSPAKGEVLATSPSLVSITFTNDIQKIAGSYGIDVSNEAGLAVTSGTATVKEGDRAVLSAPLLPDLAPGRYVVKYTNVSDADGDPFAGGYAFYVGVQPTDAQIALDAQLEPPEVAPTPTTVTGRMTPAVTPVRTSGVPATVPDLTPSTGPPNTGDDGGPNTGILVVAAIVVAAVIAGGGAFVLLRRRG